MICPKCGKNMTNTTDTKVYCMKCDILIHTPSGVAFAGDPAEDKFIGSIAVLLLGAPSRECEATLGPDALILNWKNGKEARLEKIAYPTVTGIDVLVRKRSEIARDDEFVGNYLGGGLLGVASMYLSHVKTLKISTQQKNYEMWVPEAEEWADRLRQTSLPELHKLRKAQQTGQLGSSVEPTTLATTLSVAQEASATSPPTKFCRNCGAKIARDSKFCEECGGKMV